MAHFLSLLSMVTGRRAEAGGDARGPPLPVPTPRLPQPDPPRTLALPGEGASRTSGNVRSVPSAWKEFGFTAPGVGVGRALDIARAEGIPLPE
ncbi:hypothetical protein C0R04_12290 [Streptomyces albidoflavus]|nr:hypothetical protein C0R04_12290 [Streptomyces albidoflavus]RZE96122.1 hypothetical protein C0R03_12315 [Streptomyces albidoflavus]